MNSKSQDLAPKIGEVYCMKFDGVKSEQSGWRPGVVIQNNKGNRFSPNIIALPLTGRVKKESLPTHVILPESIGLKKDSTVLCENPQRMSKDNLGAYITTIPENYMSKIAEAYILATSVISFIDINTLMTLWKKACYLNSTFE